jgi:predicted Ser/Thr protein kinase
MTEQEFFDQYVTEATAFVDNVKVDDRLPDEVVMRQLEEAVGIPEQAAWDFRVSTVAAVARGETGLLLHAMAHALQQIVGGG